MKCNYIRYTGGGIEVYFVFDGRTQDDQPDIPIEVTAKEFELMKESMPHVQFTEVE